jgi:dihydroflavonol-4-reductase
VIGVTGGTGFVGRRVVAQLAQRSPMRVLAMDTGTNPVQRAEYMVGEVTSAKDVDRFVQGCSSIIHLAGVAHSSLRTEAEKLRSTHVNVEGTRIVVNAALRHGVRRFLFVSTAHVYGSPAARDIEESVPLDAASHYSQTKIEAEKVVLEAGRKGMETVIARPCLIYGPGARFNLEQMMRGIDRHYYFHIAGIHPLRSFLSLENAARALVHLIGEQVPADIYNLADPLPYSLVDFANELADRLGRSRPRTVPLTAIRMAASVGAAIQSLGVRSPFSREHLAKLTSDFTISTARLAQTGFEWNHDTGAARQEMVNHYLSTASK